MVTHLIGLLLGTEDDWPTAFEQYLRRLAPQIHHDGQTHQVATERVTIEPFDLRQPGRHALVIDGWPTGTTIPANGSRRSPCPSATC